MTPGFLGLGSNIGDRRAYLEATIDAFRDMLEHRGVATAGWFDLQLDLCLLGMTACFGWEKAVGSEAELRWWENRALRAARHVADAYPVPAS